MLCQTRFINSHCLDYKVLVLLVFSKFSYFQVCDEPLSCIRCHENGQLVTTANDNGCIFLLEFSDNLVVSAKNDKTSLTAVSWNLFAI